MPTAQTAPVERSNYITIDLTQIPDIRREELLEAMTAPLTAFFAQPENQAKFEKWLEARAKKGR